MSPGLLSDQSDNFCVLDVSYIVEIHYCNIVFVECGPYTVGEMEVNLQNLFKIGPHLLKLG